MKILLVSPQPFFRVRGTPINIRNMLKALSEAGHEVDLVCYPFGENVEMEGLRIRRSPRFPGIRDVKVGPSVAKFPLDALMAFQVTGRILWGGYDVVHAVEESAFFVAPVARLKRIPYVVDMDSLISHQLAYSGFIRWRPLLRLVEAMERGVVKRAAKVITVCQALTDAAARLAPTASIVQIEDAPQEESFVPDPEGAELLRTRFELGDRPCIVYTGNLEAYQGIPLLLEAMSLLREEFPEALAVIVGGEERHRRALMERVQALELNRQVIFTGPLPMERMPACMTLASVLVSPRVEGENTALKLYGYMQTGKAIVATRLPTHTQVLDESTAWLCDITAKSMAAALAEALKRDGEGRDGEGRDGEGRGAKAAALIESRYGQARFRKQVQGVYEALSEQKNARNTSGR
ncbi:MAG: glycosyltransferase family 4 protein [Kiritimatiellia bacterium]